MQALAATSTHPAASPASPTSPGCPYLQITTLVERFRAGSKPVIYAGHSLGGALAMVAAAHQQLAIPGSVGAVYTFGGPRVGDAAWATAYDGLGLATITYR